MNIKLILMVPLVISLSACAKAPLAPVGPTSPDRSLSEASYSVSRSLVELSETAQASRPLPVLEAPPNPASYGMGGTTSVDWSGPIEPLVKQIASASNYRLVVLGRAPAIPLLVTVYAKNVPLADVLRDAGYQCGRRASVTVYPDSRAIELRYAKN